VKGVENDVEKGVENDVEKGVDNGVALPTMRYKESRAAYSKQYIKSLIRSPYTRLRRYRGGLLYPLAM